MLWTLRIVSLLLLFLTGLPLLSSGRWFVRWWDFPRVQLSILATVAICFATLVWAIQPNQIEPILWSIALVVALSWQLSHIIRFTKLWPTEVADARDGGEFCKLRIVVSNLDYQNPSPERAHDEIEQLAADVLLLVEFDDQWSNRLADLAESYPHRVEHRQGEGLGMAIWSKVTISSSDAEFIVSKRRVSLWAKMEIDGGTKFNFVGVHPTPPGLLDSTGEERRDSRVRDAELITVAKRIAQRAEEAWIVAGDFNDVAWSHTTRLFKRISGLFDPRIGRSCHGTYIAQHPLCRCPIDHVFLSKGFKLFSLDRKRITGSDHFAVIADVGVGTKPVGTAPRPEGNDLWDATQMQREGVSDAADRGINAGEKTQL